MTYFQRFFGLFLFGFVACGSASQAANTPVRERIAFNADWRFNLGDPAGKPQAPTDADIRKGFPVAEAAYDDAAWRRLNLPHDWGIEGPFRQEYPGDTGKLAWWGVGWYRKHFTLPAGDAGRRVYLDVDGAMSHAAVWINGRHVGGWPYGYAS